MTLDFPGWIADPRAGEPVSGNPDAAVGEVFQAFDQADPGGYRLARMMRATLDQLYDGQRTGRYSWAQLHKTERTHFGTLFEINLRREFDDIIDEGVKLDYRITGHDVDCKFSQRMGGWMIPPEAVGELLVVGFVDDAASTFAFGVVRASAEHLRTAPNRDAKVQLNPLGRAAIRWLHRHGELPPNVLLQCGPDDLEAIFDRRLSGQGRVNELFRRVTGTRIGRNTIATVAQQHDFMKRARDNGGARDLLRPEGYVILSGDFARHRAVARQLGAAVPLRGEVISLRLTEATSGDPPALRIDEVLWRVAADGEPVSGEAPLIPHR